MTNPSSLESSLKLGFTKAQASRNHHDAPSRDRGSVRTISRRNCLRALFGVPASWLLSGCAWQCAPTTECRDLTYLSTPDNFSYFFSPNWPTRLPRRVLLTSTASPRQPIELQKSFIEILASSMREAQLFEVIHDRNLPQCHCDLDVILNGQFSEPQMLELTERHNCDALMLARVNQFDYVWPMKTSVTCVMIDRSESLVIMGVDGFWDIGSPDLASAYTSFVRDQNQLLNDRYLNVNRQSPKQFQRFVAWQISRVFVANS